MTRKDLYKRVALQMLQTRSLGVIKGCAEGSLVDPQWLEDVALVSEAILNSAEKFDHAQQVKTREEILKE